VKGWKQLFGVDPVEAVLWILGSGLGVVLMTELTRDHVMGQLAALGFLVAYGIRRHWILGSLPPEGETSGGWRSAEVEGRLAELETLHARVAELEERVDFSERLLVKPERERSEVAK
jgi:hypothetical protein